jgi:hypothetical protein
MQTTLNSCASAVLSLLDSDHIWLERRTRSVLLLLALAGNPAGSKPNHSQYEHVLGSLYRPSVIISWPTRESLGHRLGYGKAEAGNKQRTSEQEKEVKQMGVQRAEKELVALGVLTVFVNAGWNERQDRRPNLYALDLNACHAIAFSAGGSLQ